MKLRITAAALACASAVLLTGCATPPSYDYTAFQRNRPTSIVILPPVNDSTSVEAGYSLMSTMTYPLAESGYYVFPVALVDETFKQNGLSNAADIESVSPKKLREIFGADAALYTHVKQYGTSYKLVSSVTTVAAESRLVDLRTGDLLWEGKGAASYDPGAGGSGDPLVILVSAVVNQILSTTVVDRSHEVAGMASVNLLAAGRPAGMLYGPRSPNYQKEQ